MQARTAVGLRKSHEERNSLCFGCASLLVSSSIGDDGSVFMDHVAVFVGELSAKKKKKEAKRSWNGKNMI